MSDNLRNKSEFIKQKTTGRELLTDL
jgi:hypothetical protein